MNRLVYLDYANLISLSRNPDQCRAFEQALNEDVIAPVISLIHVLEIVNTGNRLSNSKARSRMVDFMDEINQIKPFIWIKGLTEVVRLEVISCYESWLKNTPFEKIEPFHSSLVEALKRQLPQPYLQATRGYSFAQIVDLLCQSSQLNHHRVLRNQYPNLAQKVSQIRRQRKHVDFSDDEIRKWIKDILPIQFISSSNILVRVTDDDIREFLNAISIDTCPAFFTKLAYYQGQNYHPERTKPSTIEDIFHLVGVSYCDVSFVDKATFNNLRRGGLQRIPYQNSQFNNWINTLCR